MSSVLVIRADAPMQWGTGMLCAVSLSLRPGKIEAGHPFSQWYIRFRCWNRDSDPNTFQSLL